MLTMRNITVIGDGGWGTTIAIHLFRKGKRVKLWSAFGDYAEILDKQRINPKFLPGIKIPKGISITSDMQEAIEEADLIILAVPSCYMRRVLNILKKHDYRKAVVLSVAKGIEEKSDLRMSEVVREILGRPKFAVLSGPTIAYEVARGIPSTCVIASRDKKTAQLLQRVFTSRSLRVYTNFDVTGVELGGALKNIIALAAGISDGLGFGINTKAALVTRGLVEIARLGVAVGGRKETFSGLSGLGDIVTTCMSSYSRNRQVGEKIGKGQKLKSILDKMDMVAEGILTTKSGHSLGKKYKVELPITNEIYKVLYKNKKPGKAVDDLMTREKKTEDSQ
jgi:glycerol-3-phosphate dehydrogenase (NAD(P)+)